MRNNLIEYWAQLVNESVNDDIGMVNNILRCEGKQTINLPEEIYGALRIKDLKSFGQEDQINAILYTLTNGSGIHDFNRVKNKKWAKELVNIEKTFISDIALKNSWVDKESLKELYNDEDQILKDLLLKDVREGVLVDHGGFTQGFLATYEKEKISSWLKGICGLRNASWIVRRDGEDPMALTDKGFSSVLDGNFNLSDNDRRYITPDSDITDNF